MGSRFHGFLFAALVCVSCNQAPSPFEGGWDVTDGGVTLACDAGTRSLPVSTTLVIVDDSGHLTTWLDGALEGFDSHGDSATWTGPAFIDLTTDGGSGSSFVLTLDMDTLTIVGGTLSEHAHGTELDYSYGGVPASCDYERWLQASRVSP